jgi:hypothetical protein
MKQGKEKKKENGFQKGRKTKLFVTKKGLWGFIKNVYARALSC